MGHLKTRPEQTEDHFEFWVSPLLAHTHPGSNLGFLGKFSGGGGVISNISDTLYPSHNPEVAFLMPLKCFQNEL